MSNCFPLWIIKFLQANHKPQCSQLGEYSPYRAGLGQLLANTLLTIILHKAKNLMCSIILLFSDYPQCIYAIRHSWFKFITPYFANGHNGSSVVFSLQLKEITVLPAFNPTSCSFPVTPLLIVTYRQIKKIISGF